MSKPQEEKKHKKVLHHIKFEDMFQICNHQFVSYSARKSACLVCGERRKVGSGGIIFIYNNDEEEWEELKI